jgi:hypothetical protein
MTIAWKAIFRPPFMRLPWRGKMGGSERLGGH